MARQRRAGKTETFSISVDAETKAALRAMADAEFGGNMSALITDFAEEARRRTAIRNYLHRHGIPKASKSELQALQAEVLAEIAAAKSRAPRRRRAVA